MTTELDFFYLKQETQIRDCLLALKTTILNFDKEITQEWKYKLPFFYYRRKPVCYFWIHKKYKQPYIGFVDGGLIDNPHLLQEKRSRMKILLVDQHSDLPVKVINGILTQAIALCHKK
ncbi:DUF1801 domain-containing protein [Pedobacter insulae]|uniref:YdhG-like domain-containing protein n=1 Tax=Pedobacter insulae TaxID=414048 RepID=A0A1I3A5Y8_9SPHI|nr:DUF1801 domain-containing protein [Pedobacter insulae]SFH45286.1 protein of unknown function (DU1801) [Pedobacter insulae]